MQEVQTFFFSLKTLRISGGYEIVGVVARSITAVSRNEGSEDFSAFVGCLCVCVCACVSIYSMYE